MTKFNPFREAKKHLIRKYRPDIPNHMMFTICGALHQVWFHKQNKALTIKAIQHFKAAVLPYYSERTWLTKTVLNNRAPVDQDLQDYRHRWLDYLAQQWEEGKIK